MSPPPWVSTVHGDDSLSRSLLLLVEIGGFQPDAVAHTTALGLGHAKKNAHKRRFAGAVRPDNADAVAPAHQQVEMGEQAARRRRVDFGADVDGL